MEFEGKITRNLKEKHRESFTRAPIQSRGVDKYDVFKNVF
jgi:hypothetical protein